VIPAGTKVYFSVKPADLRKSFDGLSALALGELQKNPSEGGLFVFLNKRGNQARVLFRDRHGCCVLAKRLDRGRFRRPRVEDGCFCWELDASALMAFLDDIDLSRAQAKRQNRSVRRLELVKSPK
jgi:transposase